MSISLAMNWGGVILLGLGDEMAEEAGWWNFIMSGGPQCTAVYEFTSRASGETKRVDLAYLPRDQPMRLVRGKLSEAEYTGLDQWLRSRDEEAAKRWKDRCPHYDPLPAYQGFERPAEFQEGV